MCWFLAKISWRPGIDDPTVLGWITTAAYGAAAVMCARMAKASPKMPPPSGAHASDWRLLSVILLLLGINKQLDFQTLFTQVVRDMTVAAGIYRYRASFQTSFFIGTVILLLVVVWLFRTRERRFAATEPAAAAGVVLVGFYILLRLACFEHMERFLGTGLDVQWIGILELGGVLLITFSAWRPTPPKGR